MRTMLAVFVLTVLCLNVTASEGWGWRTDWTGEYPDAKGVIEWGKDKNIVWKTPLDKWSNATPVIVGDKIFVCEEPATLVCVSKKDGKVLWKKSYLPDGKPAPKTHRDNGYSSMTPVTDGKNVFVLSGYSSVACFDLQGNRKWMVTLNPTKHVWGTSASPVLVDGKVIVHLASTLSALDAKTGKTLWTFNGGNQWGTPLAVKCGNDWVVYTTGGDFVRVKDGKRLAKLAALPWNGPVREGNNIYVVDEREAVAYEIPEEAKEGKLKQLWKTPFQKPVRDRFYSSPVIHDGLIYTVNRRGVMIVLDQKTGEMVYTEKLPLGGTFYPSPVLTANGIIISTDNSKSIVIKPGRKFEQIAGNRLTPFRTCPVMDGNLMYIRAHDALYCIGK